MFKGLRWRLSTLYLGAALAIVVVVGGGAYGLAQYYFASSTALALQHKIAFEMSLLGYTVPKQLAAAESAWLTLRPPHPDRDEDDHEQSPATVSELAFVYILALNARGEQLAAAGTNLGPVPDGNAVQSAAAHNLDWRTITASNGEPVRLLTYALGDGTFLQAGTAITDQQNILRQLLLGLGGLGLGVTVLMGAASWWLAGRSLHPAQVAWENQQAFIANASHELRAPLTLLRASAEMAQRTLTPDEVDRRALLGDVLSETDHMARLVEDLLLLSRLDAKRVPLTLETVPLAELYEDLARQVGRIAAPRQVTVRAGVVSGAVLADPIRLRQLLLILLDNAVHHTPPGGVVTLTAEAHGARVALSVSDTGAGIAPEHSPHIFERFYRASSARTAPQGNGLGLAIAQALTGAMRGTIKVESQPGRGSRFTVVLEVASFPPTGRLVEKIGPEPK